MPFSYNPLTGELDKTSVDTTVISGIAAHSDLEDLDYASSGHTGFQPAGSYATNAVLTTVSGDIVSQIPSLTGYATESYVTTVSGDLQDNIDDKADTIHTHDDRYYTESEVDSTITTVSGDIVDQIPSLTGYATETYVSDNYINNSEMTTISGDIVLQIPDLSGYYTTIEVDDLLTTVSGDVVAQIPSAYTDEMAQDAVGGIIYGYGNVTVTYNDGDSTITISGSETGGGITEIVQDVTPELGGDLDFHGYTISGTGHIITGDHSTVSGSYEVVNVMYGTSVPTISGVPIGTLYIVYTD